MVDVLGWAGFGFILAVMVALSVGIVCFSEDPSSSEAEGKLLESKRGKG